MEPIVAPVNQRDIATEPTRRTALITGCSSGFGLLLTVALAEEGWRVIASMRDVSKRQDLDRALASAGVSERVDLIALDVCSKESIQSAVAGLPDLTDRVDLLVHNAGVVVTAFFEDHSEDDQERTLATNLVGVLNLTRAMLPMLRHHGNARIAFMSSQAVFCPLPGLSLYTATKCAIEGFAQTLAVELIPFGIDVKIIEPGGFQTSLGTNRTRVERSASPYEELSRRMHARIDEHESRFLADPDKAVRRMLPLLTGRRRRLRLVVGTDARMMWVLKHVAPWRLRRFVYPMLMGLPTKPQTTSSPRS